MIRSGVRIISLYRSTIRKYRQFDKLFFSTDTTTVLNAPWRVTFDTNPDDCNFSCVMCEQHSVHSTAQNERKASGIRRRRMQPQIFQSVIGELAVTGDLREIIPSTMGEPLMYAHFEKLIEAVQKAKVLLNLTTNGSFHPGKLNYSTQEWAAKLLPILSDVKISWNGSNAKIQESIMIGSKMEQQMNNLHLWINERDKLAANGGNRASVTLQLTFMKRNLDDIPNVVALGIRLGVDRIKGHHLWAHFKEIKDDDLRATPETVKAWNDIANRCRQLAAETLLPNGKQIRLEHFEDLVWKPRATDAEGKNNDKSAPSMVDPDSNCPFLGKEAWVNHSGEFGPCCAPDEQRKTLGNFGNVMQPGGLLGIWRGSAYQNLVKNYKNHPLCKTCHMRKAPVRSMSTSTLPLYGKLVRNQITKPVVTAVIPIAGRGTRMAPYSQIVAKAFLPVLQKVQGNNMDNGTDGFTIRAALDILLDDVLATESGIQRVVLVVSPSQIDSVLSFFRSTGLANMKGSNTIPSSVSDAVIQGEETLDILPDRVTMVVQQTPQGFGDAILCARSLLLKDKRFFVILGDHLFSCGNESGTECFKWLQRVSSTMNEENCITAVGTCTYDETSANGLIAPFHREEMTNEIWNCFPIKQMLEKPPVGTSIETLLPYTLPNRNDHREFLCHFGIDILPTERILQILSTLAQKRKSASTEICLRQAMMSMLVDDRAVLYGSLMSPPFRRHDLGNPRAYWKTLSSFANDV